MNWIERWKQALNKESEIKRLIKRLRNFKLKGKESEIESLHNEAFKEVDCLQCANCCTSIPPIVSRRDAKRIARHLNMQVKDFESTFLKRDTDGDTVINKSPCPFLESDNRCRIYEVRPAACRQYPHSGDYQFVKHLNLHQQNIRYCPALFAIISKIEKELS